MITNNDLNQINSRIRKSIQRAISGKTKGTIESEPSFTERLFSNIERDFEEPLIDSNYLIEVRTLLDRGPNSPEKKYGADFAVILKSNSKDYSISKGFLGQSKNINKPTIVDKFIQSVGSNAKILDGILKFSLPNSSELLRFQDQCRDMLAITPDSYGFLYSDEDVYIIPASSVTSSKQTFNNQNHHFKLCETFFYNFFASFIGDQLLYNHTNENLEKIKEERKIKSILYLNLKEIN
ncbi:hypothetical protein AB3N62_10965 [Leptospira sp. WS4.C2]